MQKYHGFKLSLVVLALMASTSAYAGVKTGHTTTNNHSGIGINGNSGDYGDNNAGQGATLDNGGDAYSSSKVGNTSATGGNSNAQGGNAVSTGTGVGSVGVGVDASSKNNLTNNTLTANTNNVEGSKAGAVSGSESKSGANSGSVSGSGANNSTTLGGDTTNVNSKVLWLPSHVVPVPPSLVASSTVTTLVGTCGVLQDLVTDKVEGTFNGILFDSKVDLGVRQHLVPAKTPFKEYKYGNITYLIGHQPIIFSAVLSTSGARQFGLGGNSNNGGGASGSVGASSGMQQMVQQIQLTECIMSQVSDK